MTEKILRFRWLIIAVMVLAFVPKTVQAQLTVTPEKPLLGDGSEGNPYQIANEKNLYWFADKVNNNYQTSICAVLTANITVNMNLLNDDGRVDNVYNVYSWTPIDGYEGTFDGRGFTISGLYCNEDSQGGDIGLFGYVEGANIKNVGVKDSYFHGILTVGGVCGSNAGGTITNCYNAGTVSIYGSIYDSYPYVGGVCGWNNNGTITNCYNAGTVSGTAIGEDVPVSGVCGFNNGTITNCYNTGKVSGERDGHSNVGGVCGLNYKTITNCYNTGEVSGKGNVTSVDIGGVCGTNSAGTIKNCYNTGTVSGEGSQAKVGRVCGKNDNCGTITNCYCLAAADGSTTCNDEGVTQKTDTEFKSGEVTWLLNENSADDSTTPEKTLPWLQNLSSDGGDNSPVLKANTANNVCPYVVKEGGIYKNGEHIYTQKIAKASDYGTQNLHSYICDICETLSTNKKMIKELGSADYANITITKNGENWTTDAAISLGDEPNVNWYHAPVEFTTTGEVSLKRTLTKSDNNTVNKWATLCLPYEISISNYTDKCKFYELSGVDESKITLTEITETATIAAGTPVFVKANEGVESITFSATGETKMLTAPTTGSTAGDYTLTGAFELTTLPQSSGDLFIKNDKMWDVSQVGDKDMKVKIFRAYLKNNGSVKTGAPQRSITIDGEATAISDALDTLNDANAEYYDMSGRRINLLQKGVNIIRSGNKTRKVIIK